MSLGHKSQKSLSRKSDCHNNDSSNKRLFLQRTTFCMLYVVGGEECLIYTWHLFIVICVIKGRENPISRVVAAKLKQQQQCGSLLSPQQIKRSSTHTKNDEPLFSPSKYDGRTAIFISSRIFSSPSQHLLKAAMTGRNVGHS